MTKFYFPKPEEGRENISTFSPLDYIICQRKPFGELSAEEYLEFAKNDRVRGSKADLVNALGNTKRSFHYQVDRLLYRYALHKATAKFKFPKKLELLSELQILSGTLLRVFNRERNLMEHEYAAPKEEIVDSAIDLCELLLLATERFVKNTPGRMRVKFRDDDRDLILS